MKVFEQTMLVWCVIVAAVICLNTAPLSAQTKTNAALVEAEEEFSPPTTDWFQATKEGDIDSMRAAIADGIDLDMQDPESGLTPLSWAAALGHQETVEFLLNAGADVNARNRDRSNSISFRWY